ncbi:hypothetical protein SLS58_001230 [Diplodia intermedia]|uniref:Uncharacterized protein n=1 Tax=Diplodia intermedia TaxID=856260 RepID=A0ABR3U3Q7_9PEZI
MDRLEDRMQEAEELTKQAEQALKEGDELDEKLENTKVQLDLLEGIAETRKNNSAKRQKLSWMEERIAELRGSLKIPGSGSAQSNLATDAGSKTQAKRQKLTKVKKPIEGVHKAGSKRASNGHQPESCISRVTTTSDTEPSDDEEYPTSGPLKLEELPVGTSTLAQEQQGMVNESEIGGGDMRQRDFQDSSGKPLREQHGEWSETRASEILGYLIRNPLVQTTLNYFELFMTEKMLEELKATLDQNVDARFGLQELRKTWGGPDVDYFRECAKWNSERRARRTLSWNMHYYSGYIVWKLGGPSPEDQNMDPTTYKEKYKRPLFGYGGESLNASNAVFNTKNLTELYKSFLRTRHSGARPCFAHEAGLLGSQDTCWSCGVTGSVSDLS